MSVPVETRLNLILFTVGGVFFGIDAEQTTGLTSYNGEQAEDLFWFHEELGFGNTPVSYHSPTIVTIKQSDEQPYRVIIDSMEDLAEYSQSDIRLFPALLEPFALRKGMWGILLRNGSMVLLVDFQRLIQQRRITIN